MKNIFCALALSCCPPLLQGQSYTITELPRPPLVDEAYFENQPPIVGLTQQRQCFTWATVDSAESIARYFFFAGESWVDVETPYEHAQFFAINKFGAIIGLRAHSGGFFSDGLVKPIIWQNGQVQEFNFFSNAYVYAYSINDRGDFVGAFHGRFDGAVYRPYMYADGRARELPTLGALYAWATAVNNRRQAVVSAVYAGRTAALLVPGDGTAVDIGSLGGPDTRPYAMNNRGSIVGYSFLSPPGTAHAFLYHDGKMEDIGLPEDGSSTGIALNDHDEVIGYCYRVDGQEETWESFVFRDGKRHYLRDTLVNLPSTDHWILYRATSINNRGEIAGIGMHNGRRVPFLLLPRGRRHN